MKKRFKYKYYTNSFVPNTIYRFLPENRAGEGQFWYKTIGEWFSGITMGERGEWLQIPRDEARKFFPKAFRKA